MLGLSIVGCYALLNATHVLPTLVQLAAPASAARIGYAVGDALPEIPGVLFQRSALTILAVIKSDCRYCTNSMPLYRSLIDPLNRNGDVSFVALCLEPEDSCRRYLEQHRVQTDAVVSVDSALLRIAGTPTLIGADRTGRVRDAWTGAQPPAGEDAIRRMVREQGNERLTVVKRRCTR